MGDIVYVLLGLTSVVGLTFIVERALALRWNKVVPPEITQALAACRTREDAKAVCRICQRKPSPLGRLLLLASEHLDWPKADNVDALQTAARHEIIRLERGLVVLEIIVGIAPLLGLVGTIAGMMTLFSDIGVTGLNDAARLAKGIALILNATLMGLLIAIPSLIFWSYFSKKVEVFAVEMEALCDDFIRRQYSEPASGAPEDEMPPVPNAKSRKPDTQRPAPEAKPQTLDPA
ncbi:MAG TPA: MotA/TolQ/ExbB proton channel family protein [Verrucomicrobiae bacterium]|nr:MotA/TolQ/ExbB proton channel family protein [Verrucomicrobiae bacterium]